MVIKSYYSDPEIKIGGEDENVKSKPNFEHINNSKNSVCLPLRKLIFLTIHMYLLGPLNFRLFSKLINNLQINSQYYIIIQSIKKPRWITAMQVFIIKENLPMLKVPIVFVIVFILSYDRNCEQNYINYYSEVK